MRVAAACGHVSGGNAMRNRTSDSVTARSRTRGGVAICDRADVSGAASPEYGEGNANGKARQ